MDKIILPDIGATLYGEGISITPRGLKRQLDLYGDKLERYLTARRFPIGKTILYGLPKRLKSMIAQWSGYCFATNAKWFGEDIDSGEVVYIDVEEGYRLAGGKLYYTMYLPRLLAMGRNFSDGEDLPIDTFHLWTPKDIIQGKAVLNLIDEAIEKDKPKLLILDSLGVYLQEIRFEDYAEALTELDKHLTRVERTLVVAHQKTPGDSNSPAVDAQIWGGIKQGYWAQAIWNVSRINNDDPAKVVLKFDERHGETKPIKLQFDADNMALSEISDTPELEAKIVSAIHEFLEGGERDSGELMSLVVEKASCSEVYYRTTFAKLKRKGKFETRDNPEDNRRKLISIKALGGV